MLFNTKSLATWGGHMNHKKVLDLTMVLLDDRAHKLRSAETIEEEPNALYLCHMVFLFLTSKGGFL